MKNLPSNIKDPFKIKDPKETEQMHLASKWKFSKHPTEADSFWSCGCGKKGLDKESWILHNEACELITIARANKKQSSLV